MGGIEVKVPADLAVECRGTAILGDVNFVDEEGGGIVSSRAYSRPGAEGASKKLIIDAWALMGGVEVKSTGCGTRAVAAWQHTSRRVAA